MRAIWGKGLREEMNIHLLFQYAMTPQTGDTLKIAASNLYRFTVGSQLVGYGPARAAHGYSRVDVYDLSAWAGEAVQLSLEVYSANVGTYYTVDEPPFLAAEIHRAGKCIAQADDFVAYHKNQRVQ
jgi:alpha-L-rhamnosidase